MGEHLASITQFLADKRQALRERRQLPETKMGYVGDPSVIENLVKPEDPERRLVVIWAPGGQKCATLVGIAETMEEFGLDTVPVANVGASGGLGPPFALMNKSTDQWRSIFPEDNVRNELFSLRRGPRHLVDMGGLDKLFRERTTGYDNLRSHPSDLYAAVTDAKTGHGRMINLKELDDPLTGVVASMNIPGINGGKTVEIDGREYVDGGFAYPLPISWVIKNLNPTDILVLLSEPFTRQQRMYEMGSLASLFAKDKTITDLLKSSEFRFREELRPLISRRPVFNKDGNRIRMGAVYPTESPLQVYTMNTGFIEQAIGAAREYMTGLVTTARARLATS